MTRCSTSYLHLACLAAALSSAACESPRGPRADAAVTPAPAADADAWVVTEEGYGPVRAGMTLDQASQALGAPLRPPFDVFEECDMIEVPGGVAGVTLMVLGDTIPRIDVFEAGIATAAGVAIGDSEARVHELYPGRVREEPHKYSNGKYLVVVSSADTLFRIVFETEEDGRVTTFRAGLTPAVHWVEGCA